MQLLDGKNSENKLKLKGNIKPKTCPMSKLSFNCKCYEPREFTGGTIFLIAAFKSRRWFYGPIIKALLKRGFRVIVYDYASRPLLNAHPEDWVEVTDRLTQDIASKVAVEKHKHPAARFGIIGVSVGSALALYAAKLISELEKIMLVTIYGSSAQQVWDYKVLKKVRHKFESTGRSVKDAAEVFGYLEPISHLNLIHSRKILLYANERDPVIRFDNTKLFINEAQKQGIDLTVRRIRSRRHSTTIVKVFKEPSLWTPFFMGLKHRKKDGIHRHEFIVG